MTINIAGYIVPEVCNSLCINCGTCLKICPGFSNNTFKHINADPFRGEHINAYIGHAIDSDIHHGSQSGGIVTSVLLYLLEKNKIEGAIVNKFNPATQRNEAALATTKEELILSMGSFYSQSTTIKTVLDNQKYTTAAVLLGCQAQCLHHIKNKFPKIKLPSYVFGLFCAGQYSTHYIKAILNKLSYPATGITNFRFRDKSAGGWPGNIKIYTHETNHTIDKRERHLLKHAYESHRCLYCFDQLNIFSDISFGDPWGIDQKSIINGETVFITRTEKGENLIKQAQNLGYIQIRPIDFEDIINGQTIDTRLKYQFMCVKILSEAKKTPHPHECISLDKNLSINKKTISQYKKRFTYTKMIFSCHSKVHYIYLVTLNIYKTKIKFFFYRIKQFLLKK